MNKSTLLLIVSIMIGYYTIPVIAQKVKKKYDLHELQKTHKRDLGLLSDYSDILLTTPYHPSNSTGDETILNAIIPDFQVNENTGIAGFYQGWCSISADGSGNFIIAWQDNRNGYKDVYAQMYSSDGTAVESNFQVNDVPSISPFSDPYFVSTSISADNSGNFIIAWVDRRNDNVDIHAQRYSSDGTARGSNFKVNDDQGSARQRYPSTTTDDSGNFIITWVDERNSMEDDIYAQRYASDGTALGSNFKVNDDIGIAEQWIPSISADDSGNFIIVWEDRRNGDNNPDIYAQRFASDGTALGINFKVNDDQGSIYQWTPSISTDGSGNFIIAWEDDRNSTDDCFWNEDIFAQRYASDGTALGSNFQVNDDQVCAVQYYPSISADRSGNFTITWQDERNGEYIYDIYAQQYLSDGTALGDNFKVSDDIGSAWQTDPSISIDSNGDFIIVWEDERNGNIDIYAQRYSSDGTAVESNFKVNDDISTGTQWFPSISVDGSGKFFITWQDDRNGNHDIYAQRCSSDGTVVESNFKVNDDISTAIQWCPSISTDGSGNFIITWQDERNGNYDIYAQRYSSDGIAQGSNFKVNDDIGIGNQNNPSISTDGSGNFIIAWWDERNGNTDIYTQRYTSDGTTIVSNFKVNDDQVSAYQFLPSISTDGSGNFIIVWQDSRDDINNDIYAQRYSSNGIAIGSNFKVNNDQGSAGQFSPSISVDDHGNFIITWEDYRNDDGDIYAQQYSSDGTALENNFKVNDDQSTAGQGGPSISADGNGDFIITWHDGRNGNEDIYAQRYANDGTALGANFRVTNTGDGSQNNPKVEVWNNQIYNTWVDNRAGGTGFDIWANVLDWDNPVKINDNEYYQIPSAFVLHQNYPNPFNPKTMINYQLPMTSEVQLSIFNLLGQKVATLVDKNQNAGTYQVEWDANTFASGVYYYRLDTGDFTNVKKMILIR